MKRTWWKEAVVYQVYWRSFLDTDGDGLGDLEGVIQKLDYIANLGVDVIWLNPCYESPDVDNGYDISDYRSVLGYAGTMETLERLLAETHRRGMKLIMDLVVNHTSNQHPWFVESKASTINSKRDYYIWRKEPNNWRSYFEPTTWTKDEATGEYYMHSFAKEQPDLNWDNPQVRYEIYDMMKFWLDKGFDGFRMDVITLLKKKAGFPNAADPMNISYLGNNPGIHEFLQEMHDEVLRHYDIFTVGEMPFVSSKEAHLYVGEDRKELNTMFHFEVCDYMPYWDMAKFKEIQQRWFNDLWGRGTNSQFLNNHDHPRLVSRYGNDGEYRVECAKLFATMLHTLPGMPYIYQGEELGMTGIKFATIDEYDDVYMKNRYNEEVSKGRNPEKVLQSLQHMARDNSRTPMQWTAGEHAGFTSGKPWIKMNPNYTEINAEAALADPHSIYYYYQKLIQLRKANPVMIYGDYKTYFDQDEQLYVYSRTLDKVTWLVVLNVSEGTRQLDLPLELSARIEPFQPLLGNLAVDPVEPYVLRPYEARIYGVDR